MPGQKINLIGSSNHLTNSTNVFGNMPGLAPTVGVPSHITATIPGYKFLRVAGNGFDWVSNTATDPNALSKGCGLGKNATLGKNCLEYLNLYRGTRHSVDPVRSRSILG